MSIVYHNGMLYEGDKAIYFDMDGTIADLYGVMDWLAKLENSDATPYREAPLMVSVNDFLTFVGHARQANYKLGIISWLSKGSTAQYDNAVIDAKLDWLYSNLPQFDEIIIASYGMPKHELICPKEAILVDDEQQNRVSWNNSGPNRTAYHVNDIPALMTMFTQAAENLYDMELNRPIDAYQLVELLNERFEEQKGCSNSQKFELCVKGGGAYIDLGGEHLTGTHGLYDELVSVADIYNVTREEAAEAFAVLERIMYEAPQ